MTLAITKQGIPDFYWPLEREFIVSPVQKIVALTAEYAKKNDGMHACLPVLLKWIIIESLKVIEATVHADAQQKRSYFFPEGHYGLLKRFQSGELEGFSQTLAQSFAKGAPIGMQLPVPLKMWLRNIQRNGFWRSAAAVCGGDHFMTIDPVSLAVQHAKKEGVFLAHHHLSQWMGDVRAELSDSMDVPEGTEAFIADLIAIIEAEIVARKLTFADEMRQHITQLIRSVLGVTLLRAKQLEPKVKGKKLWLGSTGAGFPLKLLAHTMRRQGGYVVAHDHGYGNGQIENSIASHVVEYNSCDEFVTYTDHVATQKAAELDEAMLFGMKKPKIPHMYASVRREPVSFTRGKIKRVMYVPTAYHSEGARLRPIQSDAAYVDYQMRLFAHLKEQNIEVVYKPHPGGRFNPSQKLAEYFGVKLLTAPFEHVRADCDAYLIDFMASSTTAPILCSDKPVIFINLGYPTLHPAAKPMLYERCEVLDATVNKQNRIELDWQALNRVLLKETHRFNSAFADLHYGTAMPVGA